MEEKKNLCAPIPLSLHQRLRAEQEQRGQTLADYITDILNEHFEGGAKTWAIPIAPSPFRYRRSSLTG